MTGARRRLGTGGTIALAAALIAVAFTAKGGTDLDRLVAIELWLILASAVVLLVSILTGRAERLSGIGSVVAFAALAIVTALSVEWSLTPDSSWIEANRTFAYLFVFAAAVTSGNLLPRALPGVLGAITLAAVALVTYGLLSRVFPAALAETEFYARLGQPFGYWNALGVTAAMGLVGAVWFGTRREVGPRLAAVAAPATALLTVALFLTYSRSALLAAAVAVAVWIAFVPRRLRSVAVLVSGGVGAVPAVAWALSQEAFTADGVELSVREDAGTTFGLLLLLAVVLAYAICAVALTWRERRPLPHARRQAFGSAACAGAVVLALFALGAMATTERGIAGTIADRFDELTDDSAAAGGGPGRLGTTASSRSRYWRAGLEVFEDRPLTGAGAGAFEITGLRYRKDPANLSRHAHGYFVQTLADLGLVGLAASLVALVAWLYAALRAVGATPRSQLAQRFLLGDQRVDYNRAPLWTEERVVAAALFLIALVYGLQSAADWTWFVPGPTVMALIAAGYVAGRPAPGAPADPAAAPHPAGRPRWRAVAAVFVATAALVGCWSAWQPQRAEDLLGDSLALAAGGDYAGALDKAERAHDTNPLAPQPLWTEAALLAATNRFHEAEAVLERVLVEHPNLPEAWLRLADFRLDRLNQPRAALAAVEPAIYLDPQSAAVRQSFIDIRDRFRAAGLLPGETAPPFPPE